MPAEIRECHVRPVETDGLVEPGHTDVMQLEHRGFEAEAPASRPYEMSDDVPPFGLSARVHGGVVWQVNQHPRIMRRGYRLGSAACRQTGRQYERECDGAR